MNESFITMKRIIFLLLAIIAVAHISEVRQPSRGYRGLGILGDLSDIGLAESKWGYSNVSTGAGVVAAQSSSKFTIDLKEFLKTTLNNK